MAYAWLGAKAYVGTVMTKSYPSLFTLQYLEDFYFTD